MFVDCAGATIPVYDSTTGQAWPASLFVSVLGASSYTSAEATRDQQLEAWIQAHIHALEFFGGARTLAVPDNTKPKSALAPLPAERFDMSQWSLPLASRFEQLSNFQMLF